jgi:hypothetical protein
MALANLKEGGSMKTKCILIALFFSVLPVLAQAQTMDLQWFKQQFKSINERANWKLFSDASDVDFYYDANNIQRTKSKSAIIAIKTVYKSQKAKDRLKHERNRRNGGSSEDDSVNYNYDDLSFTINIDEIYCTMRKVGSQDIEADFDEDGYILNIVPSGTGVVPIVQNTHIEKLYFLICEKGDSKSLK